MVCALLYTEVLVFSCQRYVFSVFMGALKFLNEQFSNIRDP